MVNAIEPRASSDNNEQVLRLRQPLNDQADEYPLHAVVLRKVTSN